MPWYVKVGDHVIEHQVLPALTVNDEALETEAAVAGHVVELLTSVAAGLFRSSWSTSSIGPASSCITEVARLSRHGWARRLTSSRSPDRRW